jgi:hypothetical protein
LSLAEIASKLRKVKYGDFVLADDHNNLVDAVKLIFDCKYDIPSSDIASKLRKVKQGDNILDTDHNDLVDSVTLISKWIDFDYTYSDEKYSLTNKGTPQYYALFKSIYSKKMQINITKNPYIISGLWSEGYITNTNQWGAIEFCIHKSDHPAGELTVRSPSEFDDCIYSGYTYFPENTPTMHKDRRDNYFNPITEPLPNTVYLVVWLANQAYQESPPFTVYVNNFKIFLLFFYLGE